MTSIKERETTRRTRRPGRGPLTVALAAAAIAALAGCSTPFSHAAGPVSVRTTAAATAASPAAAAATATATATPAASAAAARAATQKVSTTDKTGPGSLCPGQEAWSLRAVARVKALYADTGALAADASANNQPAIAKAGRKLAADALAAATLTLPPADPGDWKALTAAYAAAGTALAEGDTSGAVPALETGGNAMSAFSSAVARCLAATG
jgi:hypothetical protein